MIMTTQKQIRAAFWAAHPQFKRLGATKHDDYSPEIRVAFWYYVQSIFRSDQISDALANRATL